MKSSESIPMAGQIPLSFVYSTITTSITSSEPIQDRNKPYEADSHTEPVLENLSAA